MNLRAAADLHILGLRAVHDEGTRGLFELLTHIARILNAETVGVLTGDDERQQNMMSDRGPTSIPALPDGILDHPDFERLSVKLDRETTNYDLIVPIRSSFESRPIAHMVIRLKLVVKRGEARPVRPSAATLSAMSQLLAHTLVHRAMHQRLHEAATRDGLTGLFTRTRILELGKGLRGDCCALMVDIDHFKAVNDTHGHPAGDQVLIGVARVLERCLRASDLIGRYGGEEFLCIVEGDEFVGSLLAERIRSELEKTPIRIGRERIRVTTSIGMSEYVPDGSTEVLERAIKNADEALYASKRNGRNRVTTSSPTP